MMRLQLVEVKVLSSISNKKDNGEEQQQQQQQQQQRQKGITEPELAHKCRKA